MKRLRFLSLTLIFALLCNPTVLAFHAPPWDTGHNSFTGDPGDTNTDPGTCDGECGSCPCTGKAMSPVEAASGNFIYTMRVLTISGLGPSLDVSLTYNSHDRHRGPFGVGWVNPYEQRIIETTDGTNNFAVYSLAQGKREKFTKNQDGTYTAPPRLFSKLTKNSDGTHTLRDKYGLVRRFNGQGQLTAIVDRNGNTLSLAYDATGFMTTITDASGRIVKLTKGADGRVESMSDPANRTFRFAYDTAGNLTRYTDPLGNNASYQYDSSNNLTALVDPRGNTLMRLTYDTTGRVSQHFDGAETWTYTYSPSLKRTTKRDSQGNNWIFDYNDNGNVTKITDPFGKIEQYVLDSNLNVTQFTNKNGKVTKYTYDSVGNQLTTTDALNNIRKTTYELQFNRPLTIQDATGNTTRFEYDARGNLLKTINARGQGSQFQYDSKGQLTRITDALGNSSTLTYDNRGNITQTIDPLLNSNTATFDILGKVLTATDAEGRTTQYEYDANERVTRIIDALGGATINEYDVSGNLTAVTIPGSQRTTFQYDFLNRLIGSTNPLGQGATYTYDRKDNLVSKTDAKGQRVDFAYDSLERLVRKTKPDDTVNYSYDSLGNLLSVTDGDSNLNFFYNDLSQLIEARTVSSLGQPASVIKFAYDPNGNRTRMIDPDGGVTTYAYDNLQRLTTLTDPSGQRFSITYDALSRRTRIDRPTGLSTTYTYDASNRVTSLVHQGGPGTLTFNYSYDRLGNRRTKSDGTGSSAYAYDRLSRLTSVSTGSTSESYSYDSLGNRTTSHLSNSYSHNAANRLTRDASFDYTYDENGNRTRKVERAVNKTTNYSYDSENQLVRIDFPNGTNATYRYDGLGRRIEKNANGQVTQFIYDGQDILLEYTGTALSARYTHGPGIDEVLSVKRGGNTSFFQTDALGSIIRVVENSQVKASYSYDAFGQTTGESGTSPASYAFQGRELDRESNLYYFRSRYYDGLTGRFLTEDPLRFIGGDNFYEFVSNNPTNLHDPYGLIPLDTIWDVGNVLYDLIFDHEALPYDLAATVIPYVPAGASKLCKLGKTSKALRGENAFTKAGREAHKAYNPGSTYKKEVTLPSGKRADAVDFENKIVRELKPDNPNAVRRGERQVEQYRQELQREYGGEWKGVVDTYKRDK